MMEKPVTIDVGKDTVSGLISVPSKEPRCFAVLCHGLLSSKDSHKYKVLSKRLSEKGIPALRFDFRGCGESSGSLLSTTLSTRVEDLMACIDYMERFFPRKALVMGSSLGGVVASIACSRRNDIKATSLWATPAHFRDINRKKINGRFPPIGDRFVEELRSYSINLYAKNLKRPLIIHGSDDEIVPVEHAKAIYEMAPEPKKLVVVDGADHVFSKEEHLETAVRETIKWFKEVEETLND